MNKLVPFSKEQKALNEAYSEIFLRKRTKQNVYALTFFKYYFGSEKPESTVIKSLVNTDVNITESITIFNDFLESFGEKRKLIYKHVIVKIFPSISLLTDERIESHSNLKMNIIDKIEDRNKIKHSINFDIEKENITRLGSSELVDKVYEYQTIYNEYEIKILLEIWFKSNVDQELSFDDLFSYRNFDSLEIAYHLVTM